jgi:hypothetical protein
MMSHDLTFSLASHSLFTAFSSHSPVNFFLFSAHFLEAKKKKIQKGFMEDNLRTCFYYLLLFRRAFSSSRLLSFAFSLFQRHDLSHKAKPRLPFADGWVSKSHATLKKREKDLR